MCPSQRGQGLWEQTWGFSGGLALHPLRKLHTLDRAVGLGSISDAEELCRAAGMTQVGTSVWR